MARYLSKAKFAYSYRSPNSCGRENDCLGISTRTFGPSAFCVASAADQMDAREVSIVSIATTVVAATLSVNRVSVRRTVDRYIREANCWMRLTNLIFKPSKSSTKTRQF